MRHISKMSLEYMPNGSVNENGNYLVEPKARVFLSKGLRVMHSLVRMRNNEYFLSVANFS